ncbi:MAG: hypothetical protein AAF961_02495 [Planctomycetota bacterium]
MCSKSSRWAGGVKAFQGDEGTASLNQRLAAADSHRDQHGGLPLVG